MRLNWKQNKHLLLTRMRVFCWNFKAMNGINFSNKWISLFLSSLQANWQFYFISFSLLFTISCRSASLEQSLCTSDFVKSISLSGIPFFFSISFTLVQNGNASNKSEIGISSKEGGILGFEMRVTRALAAR